MARLVFKKGDQSRFLTEAQKVLRYSVGEMASVIGIAERSYRYWLNEKVLGRKDKLYKISNISQTELPKIVEEREEFWSGRVNGSIGGKKRFSLYGVPGNPLSRIKGGQISQRKRRELPDYYRSLGCNVAKKFIEPKHSEKLAEIVWIILGDGGITQNQLKVTLNSEADLGYDSYLCKRLKELFGTDIGQFKRKKAKAIDIFVSGVELVGVLKKIGLKVGNKVLQQVAVPKWIVDDPTYSRLCLRGLMDTDGGIFKNEYKTGNVKYSYLKVCFTNKSVPLINFVETTLKQFGFNPKVYNHSKVWLCSEKEVIRYLNFVGSSNNRLNKWLKW